MKYIKRNYLYICFALVVALFNTSCDSDDAIISESKAYINTEIYPINQVKIDLTHTPTSVIPQSETNVKFPIKLTMPASSQVRVKVSVDHSLFESYNEENGTEYNEIPAEGYKLNKDEVTISEGKMISTDSISFVLNDLSSLNDENGYMIPLKIIELTTNDKGVEISSNLSAVYITINNSFINIDPTATTIEGEPLDKTNWTAEGTLTFGDYIASNAIDGDNSTVWFASVWSDIPVLSVNMGSEQTFKGFRITPNYTAFSKFYGIKRIEVFISDDGKRWISQGVSPVFDIPSGSVGDPDYKIIKFYEPVKTTYFRFRLVENHDYYTGIAEIDAIN